MLKHGKVDELIISIFGLKAIMNMSIDLMMLNKVHMDHGNHFGNSSFNERK